MTKEKTYIEILTEKDKFASGSERTADVLVRITPPSMDNQGVTRPKLNIGIALDRSGSMQGQKMREAREASKYCVDQMLPHDRFSAVIFDDQVDVLFTSQPVSDRETLKRGLDRIEARSSTALHEGWVKAGLQVSEHLDTEAINRILLITDGQANVGETNVDTIVDQARKLAARGVSTSTIGIGRDFNEDLLIPMAEAGQGNSWHVEEPQDMVKIFETELRGLVNQVGHSVTFEIKPADGVVVTDVLNDFERDDQGRYKLPNLQAGSPLDIVVRLRVRANTVGTTADLAAFTLSYVNQDSELPEARTAALAVSFASPAEVDALAANAEVATAVQLLMNARARREAVSRMDNFEFEGALKAVSLAKWETDIQFSVSPSPQLAGELKDLTDLEESLKLRENDDISRKRMSYRREVIRKSK
jgi:Ca-activated chloride channel family protein